MAEKKQAAKKAATKKPVARRARNKDGTYKGDDKSTPDVNEAYEQPKPGTKATTKPRNPVAKQREATAKKAPAKKPHVYAPKVKPLTSPVEDMLTKDIKPAETLPPTLSRYTPPPPKKKGRVGKMWTWLVGQ